MQTKNIQISDYTYNLPDEKIAKFPITPRDHSKLLVYNHGTIKQDHFYNISHWLPQKALMVYNNTKVIQARIHFRKSTGALIEVFLLEPAKPADYEQMFQSVGRCSWICMVGNLKKWKTGTLEREFEIRGCKFTLKATRREFDAEHTLHSSFKTPSAGYWIDFEWDNTEGISFSEILQVVGELPIPPYLNRETEESDKTTYQTVYSKIMGSVAAPTAGLHFTDRVLESINKLGVETEELTLHVGAGTFKPVKQAEIKEHEMHTEFICVHKQTLAKLLEHDCKTIAVGTTSVRTLESLYYMGVKLENNKDLTEEQLHVFQWEPYEHGAEGGLINQITPQKALQNILDYLEENELNALHSSTQIIIAPGYEYKYVKMLITNFHQPQSTLLLLVSAFVKGDWKPIYDYALSHDFRFLSYGDSSLLIP
uniref:S-adenosylmethionine:tRNA ribosyltransferase-isomerase n=1 Tax=Prevotella sp. GTC17253 TaxID=3236793 RepID=A0AB33IXS0_9BACT